MPDIYKAVDIALSSFCYDAGKFYGDPAGLNLGVGLIYDHIPYPIFDREEKLFDTALGLVYVLSHECDLDGSNQRFFNDCALVCPIIQFSAFAQDFCAAFSEDKMVQMVRDLAGDKVFRAIYIPPISGSVLADGGILYFNQITNTSVSSFEEADARPICALSSYAQRIIDKKLENHLLRPKQQLLPLSHC